MVPISKTVQTIIQRSPVLREALVDDLINLSGLARHIQSEVETKFLKPASIGSIVMALQRLQFKLRKNASARYLQQPITANISVRSNLVLFRFEYSRQILEVYQNAVQQLQGQRQVFTSLSCGVNEVACLINAGYANILKEAATKLKLIDQTSDLSAITLQFTFDTIHAPGVYYRILQVLAWEQINLIEVMSAGDELTLVFEDAIVDSAFVALKRLVKPNEH